MIDFDKAYAQLEFDEPNHLYTWAGKRKNSTTNYLKRFIKPFDVEGSAARIAKRENTTVEKVRHTWDLDTFFGISKGNMVHFYSEDWANGERMNPLNEWQAGIIQFWVSLPKHYVFIHAELKMYSWILDICGTCDVLLFNTLTGKFVLVDYKTNKDLFSSYGILKMWPYTIPDSNFNKYGIQLSIYEIMLSEIGVEIEDKWIIWTKRTNNQLFQKHSVPDFKQDVLDRAA